ncbi:PiggyBac transposable element-derived protein 4 [Araneus ventricosus]|uniref:PiggyBac transposable element-derived protein 4 n=1 Tax=Araneus ventricosus TaxID=182803 RepID=A0A4Y2FM91_ARAVE|nr:PiggyBac transposable element-derived protein 4 [Araneus ventricosus]
MDSEEYSESDSSYEDISDESDSDEDTLDAARNWCRIDQENLAPPPPRFPFSGNPGLNTRMDGSSLIEFFCIFFDDDIVGYIASETNLYAEDFIEKNDLTPSSRVPKWKDVDSSEIRVFLGIIILQGIVQKPLQKWYWSQRPLLSTPYLKQLMSEKRFSIIMKFLHFTNNETIDLETHPQPGLRKVYEVYDAINRKFKSSYVPERDVSVDESLLLYKGRLGCKQYLPKKRARFFQENFTKYVSPPPTVFSIPRETSENRIVVFTYQHSNVTSSFKVFEESLCKFRNKGDYLQKVPHLDFPLSLKSYHPP